MGLAKAPYILSGNLIDVKQAYLSISTARCLLKKLPCSFGAFKESEAFTSLLLRGFCRCQLLRCLLPVHQYEVSLRHAELGKSFAAQSQMSGSSIASAAHGCSSIPGTAAIQL